jgi:hypothetical protein
MIWNGLMSWHRTRSGLAPLLQRVRLWCIKTKERDLRCEALRRSDLISMYALRSGLEEIGKYFTVAILAAKLHFCPGRLLISALSLPSYCHSTFQKSLE